MRTWAAISVTALCLAVAACGGEASSAGDFEGEQRAVAEVVEELQEAGQRSEPDKICAEILAKELRDRIAATGSDCDEEMRKVIEDADTFELSVEKVTVTGSRASAVVEGDAGGAESSRRTFEFVNEAGQWRATSFGAS